MKKLFLILALVTLVSTKAFADFSLGGKFNVDINNSVMLGGGLSLGLGDQDDHVFILDLLVQAYPDTSNLLHVKASVDWHALRWDIAILQLYLGLGIGAGFEFDTYSGLYDPQAFGFDIVGRIPVGLKVFLGSLELFFEVTPQLGWATAAVTAYDSSTLESHRISSNDFYWAVGASLGLRFWM